MIAAYFPSRALARSVDGAPSHACRRSGMPSERRGGARRARAPGLRRRPPWRWFSEQRRSGIADFGSATIGGELQRLGVVGAAVRTAPSSSRPARATAPRHEDGGDVAAGCGVRARGRRSRARSGGTRERPRRRRGGDARDLVAAPVVGSTEFASRYSSSARSVSWNRARRCGPSRRAPRRAGRRAPRPPEKSHSQSSRGARSGELGRHPHLASAFTRMESATWSFSARARTTKPRRRRLGGPPARCA